MADYPCECERDDLGRGLKQVITQWVLDQELVYDWRKDFDLMEEVWRIVGAFEYSLCRACALREKRAEQGDTAWEERW